MFPRLFRLPASQTASNRKPCRDGAAEVRVREHGTFLARHRSRRDFRPELRGRDRLRFGRASPVLRHRLRDRQLPPFRGRQFQRHDRLQPRRRARALRAPDQLSPQPDSRAAPARARPADLLQAGRVRCPDAVRAGSVRDDRREAHGYERACERPGAHCLWNKAAASGLYRAEPSPWRNRGSARLSPFVPIQGTGHLSLSI